MGSIIKSILFLISFEFFLYILSAYLLLNSAMVFVYKLQVWEALGLVPSIACMGLAVFNRVSAFVYDLRKKKRHTLISLGIIIIFTGILLNSLYRFEGIADLGEGERLSDYYSIKKGPLAGVAELNIAVGAIEGDVLKSPAKSKVQLMNDEEKTVILSPGDSEKWESPKARFFAPGVSVLRTEPAPRFSIINNEGKELHSAFVKLSLNSPGKEDYFRSPALPHRFYMSLTGKEETPFKLKIMRGKIIIKDVEIGLGREEEFEGFSISIPEMSKWVELEVRHYPGNMVIIAGVVTALAGAAMTRVKRDAERGES